MVGADIFLVAAGKRRERGYGEVSAWREDILQILKSHGFNYVRCASKFFVDQTKATPSDRPSFSGEVIAM